MDFERHNSFQGKWYTVQCAHAHVPNICVTRYTIEIEPHLQARATTWLTEAGYMSTGRLHTRLGDGYLGWPTAARFDGIIVTCSPTHVPQPLKDQLAVGGRMIIPVGPDLALSR